MNECANNADNDCNINASCTDNDGSYTCACDLGYTGDGFDASTGCTDVDECLIENVRSTLEMLCHSNAACTNTDGSYTCGCYTGYSDDGFTDGT